MSQKFLSSESDVLGFLNELNGVITNHRTTCQGTHFPR
jgi:hypothetical protein